MSLKKETAQRIAAERKEQILNAAITLFDEKGYGNTTISEIAKKAGISKGLIYNYYNSKLDILKATEKIIADCETLIKSQSSVYDALYKNASRLIYDSDVTNYYSPIRVLLSSAVKGEISAEDFEDMPCGNIFKPHLGAEVLSEVVKKGQETGEIRSGDPVELADFIWTYTIGLIIQIKYCHNPLDLEEAIRKLCELLK